MAVRVVGQGHRRRWVGLDTLIAVRDEDCDGFVAHWRDWLSSITPTLIARELPFAPGSFYSTTLNCERLDVIVEEFFRTLAISPLMPDQRRDYLVVLGAGTP